MYGSGSNGVANPRVQVLGEVGVLVPRLVSFKELTGSSLYFSQWVETEGVVRSAAMQDGRFTLELTADGKRAKVRVLDAQPDQTASLTDSKVRVLGVGAALVSEVGDVIGVQLF